MLAFAGARDVLGTDEIEVEVEALTAATAGAVMDLVVARHPDLAPHRPTIRLAVNGEYVHDGEPVKAGDEVALIPPVAGG
ncbi:MAG TPA: MoaD/ThiS family protein [Polyangiaceae bacterium]|nr:MoaD/ThiS family protein [Polyangiaceae bacterium]